MTVKILVIEKDNETRERIKALFEKEKYEVLFAPNGKVGIIISNTCKPDLILCGVLLPDIDGYEILQILNNEKYFLLTPFIFLSSKTEREYYRKGMELGADDYISKPFDDGELLRAILVRLEKYKLIKNVKENIEKPAISSTNSKILLHSNNQLVKVLVDKIIYIHAQRQYTDIIVEGGKQYVAKKALIKWEAILPDAHFVRIHRSTLINLNYIRKIVKRSNNYYTVYLHNIENAFEVSRRYYKNLKKHTLKK